MSLYVDVAVCRRRCVSCPLCRYALCVVVAVCRYALCVDVAVCRRAVKDWRSRGHVPFDIARLTSGFQKTGKMGFLGHTILIQNLISIWSCTARYRGMWVSRFGGFRGRRFLVETVIRGNEWKYPMWAFPMWALFTWIMRQSRVSYMNTPCCTHEYFMSHPWNHFICGNANKFHR